MSLSYLGHLPEGLWDVLTVAWEANISIQGDFARSHASEVALAASLGWLSNISPDGLTFSRHWRITAPGLTAIKHKEFLTP